MSLWKTLSRPFRKQSVDVNAIQEMASRMAKRINASYDAAGTGGADMVNYWAYADAFDADSANSKCVRDTLVRRSRYELANNGYADGIAQTYATDLVGVGPQLRMQTNSTTFNQMVERTWYFWAQQIQFRRKLWCMAHAKHGDGEAFGILRRNPGVNHPIKIDLVLHETEQCQTPLLSPLTPGKIDGIEFDDFGNPTAYEFLKYHPGSSLAFSLDTERIAAKFVVHWFKMRRPGQHRGVPECASTLNLGGAFRRFREANLRTAEKIAAWTLLLKTLFEPEEIQSVPPLSTMDVVHGMLTALPNSYEPFQLKAEQPGPQYEQFFRSLLSEQARPKCMSYNKAACDSKDSNYASGRLDFMPYYDALDIDRGDCNDLVLDRMFDLWFDIAIATFGWLGGVPEQVSPFARAHSWDWPKHPVADVNTEATANETKLKSCQLFLHRLFSDQGLDFEDEIEAAAASLGVSVDELKQRVLDTLYQPKKQPGAVPQTSQVGANRIASIIANGNGKHG